MRLIETDDVVIADWEAISQYNVQGDCDACGTGSDLLFEGTPEEEGIIISGINDKEVKPYATAQISNGLISNVVMFPLGEEQQLKFKSNASNGQAEFNLQSTLLKFYVDNRASNAPEKIETDLLNKIATAMDSFIAGELKTKLEKGAAKAYLDIASKDKSAVNSTGFAGLYGDLDFPIPCSEMIQRYTNFKMPPNTYKSNVRPFKYKPGIKLSGKPKVFICPKKSKFSLKLTATNGQKKEYCVSAFIYFQSASSYGIRFDELSQLNDLSNISIPNWPDWSQAVWNPHIARMQQEIIAALNSPFPNQPIIYKPSNYGEDVNTSPAVDIRISSSRQIIQFKLIYPLEPGAFTDHNWWFRNGRSELEIGAGGIIDAVRMYQFINGQQNAERTRRESIENGRQSARTDLVAGQPETPTTPTVIDYNTPVISAPGNMSRPDSINQAINSGNTGRPGGAPNGQNDD